MRTTQDTPRYLLLCIMLFSTPALAQEADKAALWPSDALSNVMRSDTPPAGSERSLRISDVPKLSHLNLWYGQFEQVHREDAELWFYTCCHPVGRYPNRFLDQSLLKVTVNGNPVGNVRPSGYFLQAQFMSSNNPTIEATIEHEGRRRTAKRTFDLQDPGDKIFPT